MRSGLVDALVRGALIPWLLVAALWAVAAGVLLLHRGRTWPTPARVISVLAMASAVALAGVAVSAALAVPRIRWRTVEEPDLVSAEGESWRRLRGPTVQVMEGDGAAGAEAGADRLPDIGVPTIDKQGRWVLFGLLSGRAVEGLQPAPEAPPVQGAPRLCQTKADGDSCRAWPAGWPHPDQGQQLGELGWTEGGVGEALAYDVELGLYLRVAKGELDGGPVLNVVGRVSTDTLRGSPSPAPLFVVRRVAGGRLTAARIVATHAGPLGTTYALQRAGVSLAVGPRARALVMPALVAVALGLPLGAVAYLLAPAWLARALRRRGAVKRDSTSALVLLPLLRDAAPSARAASLADGAAPLRRGREALVRPAVVSEDADLGDALLPRGAVVPLGVGADDDRPVASRSWFELPPSAPDARGRGAAPGAALLPSDAGALGADAAVPHAERGSRRRVGILIPADAAPLARTARSWLSHAVQPLAIAATGVAAAAPAVVAVASLLW